MLPLRTVLLAALLVPLAGCPAPAEADPTLDDPTAGGVVTNPVTADNADLAAARDKWRAATPQAYTMTLRRSCFCMVPDDTGPFAVTVAGGDLASVRLAGAEVDDDRGMTVEALFELIEEAYAEGAESVKAEYDPTLGYPTNVYIDYSTQLADEEIGYMVSDFVPTGR